MVKVIVIPKVTPKQRKVFSEVINQIVKATNWQNRITLADLQTNDDEQIRLERALLELNYNYLRRRQSGSETMRLLRKKKRPRVVKEKLAQYIAACVLDPVIAQAKNRLFDNDYYPKLFNKRRSGYEYLSFHWLGAATEHLARKDRARRYAKWTVLNLMYEDTAFLQRMAYQEQLVQLCEVDRRMKFEMKPLRAALDAYFTLAAGAYREQRKKDEDLDLATFFKRATAVVDIRRAIRSPRNAKVAARARRAIASLRAALDKADAAAA